MGVRTSILAITPLTAETSTAAANGQDLPGMLNFAAEKVADAIQVLNAIADFLPAGSNLTAIQAQITALT
ncbi:hypothetical protein [Burkholderia gladioli]|uniref:hypothetical protein n=1 Tax=Burkholderia gladioli TaxID=28095 RepID=UPI001640EFFF|nr:hypothetical protein [Burkholderia gladioli]